ncbi:uncharacterized protein BJ212DRAFT_1338228 [Suillus subaureus]|uniref:Uncharacterized protein n=1 Tax=Suillus subaureus TaxID=48587 RepID=A0A9P7JFQ5_9AGAM|nr:uncharacterized protein BJ212DRAFT_1338228 [Suillus subaureus]KAG1820142.1 hypothetical protein BJ212DRAFT_1338228 [Suillus subaureus]
MAHETWSLAQDKPRNDTENRQNKQSKKGTSWLLRILISESVHLIWVLRCEKTISGTEARKINRTQTFQNLVTATWTDIITSTDPLPKNWAIALEVLVGIKQPRPSPNEAPR